MMEDQQAPMTDDQKHDPEDGGAAAADARRPKKCSSENGGPVDAYARRSEVQRRRWRTSMHRRPTIKSTVPKMEDQQALTPHDQNHSAEDDEEHGSKDGEPQAPTPDDQKHGAEDGGPAVLDNRRSDARRRRCRTCKRRRPTISSTAPKMDDQQAPKPDDQKHAAKN